MKEFVQYVAQSLVEHKDQVVVTQDVRERTVVLRLKVASEDLGRVIGKQGRVAEAMRTLLKVAAIKEGTRVLLEIGP